MRLCMLLEEAVELEAGRRATMTVRRGAVHHGGGALSLAHPAAYSGRCSCKRCYVLVQLVQLS